MKTKMIDVWVDDSIVDNLESFSGFVLRTGGRAYTTDIKAKLIIEIPEKKIEITERELEAVCQYVESECYVKQDEPVHYHFVKRLKALGKL